MCLFSCFQRPFLIPAWNQVKLFGFIFQTKISLFFVVDENLYSILFTLLHSHKIISFHFVNSFHTWGWENSDFSRANEKKNMRYSEIFESHAYDSFSFLTRFLKFPKIFIVGRSEINGQNMWISYANWFWQVCS